MSRRKFERVSCSRCGGSGSHSYCQMYGTTCFKCHGSGKTLTKRGKAANLYATELLSKRADAVEVGDSIRTQPGPLSCGGWLKSIRELSVTSILSLRI